MNYHFFTYTPYYSAATEPLQYISIWFNSQLSITTHGLLVFCCRRASVRVSYRHLHSSFLPKLLPDYPPAYAHRCPSIRVWPLWKIVRWQFDFDETRPCSHWSSTIPLWRVSGSLLAVWQSSASSQNSPSWLTLPLYWWLGRAVVSVVARNSKTHKLTLTDIIHPVL